MRQTIFICAIFVVFQLLNSCRKDFSKTPPELIEIDMSQLSFPGAEGYGAFSKGGRGGELIYVTNLNDSGEGSLRHAVEQPGARTVIFAVSGIIELESLIIVTNPYLTIAGQTAPGEGVTIKNCGIYIETHDVIIRYIKIRPGDDAVGHPYEDRDAITIGKNSYSVIIDHVSASWSTDEIMSTWYEPQFITFQWCILSEALSESYHPKGEHSKALLIGDNTQKVSVHHNVFAHNNDRSPALVKGGASCNIVNNIIYNWGQWAFSFSIDYVKYACKVNLIGNYFKEGNSTTGDFLTADKKHKGSEIYINDNTGNNDLLIEYNNDPQSFIHSKDYLVSSPVDWESTVFTENIEIAYDSILNNCGAVLPMRDAVDTRIINDIRNNTGSIIHSQNDVGGFPVVERIILTESELDQTDADRDGMNDDWELENGLNPNNPDDRNYDPDGDGFTNLEEYLNRF